MSGTGSSLLKSSSCGSCKRPCSALVDHNVIVQRTAYAYLNALKKANGTYAPHDA